MDRYNPFAADALQASTSSQTAPVEALPALATRRQQSRGSNASTNGYPSELPQSGQSKQAPTELEAIPSLVPTKSRYTTSFPDPFGDGDDERTPAPAPRMPPVTPIRTTSHHSAASDRNPINSMMAGAAGVATAGPTNRSNSVTFLHKVGTEGDAQNEVGFGSTQYHRSQQPIQRGGRQASGGGGGGFSSFLSRATSVTSSSVTDRVSSTLGSMRGAVDSLSSQFQASADAPQVASGGGLTMALDNRQLQQESATICRQRVVLIVDTASNQPGGIDWAGQFNAYRRLVRGLPPQSSLGLSSFFSSSGGGAGFTLGNFATSQAADPGADLIEQANFRNMSVLANQTSGTAAVQVSGGGSLSGVNTSNCSPALPVQLASRFSLSLGVGGGGNESQQQQLHNLASGARIVRPEFVVVRQRGREHSEHLKGVVGALDYCLVPMFEPYEIWSTFQDRQMIFAKLLRVQRQLGKERFPLIPQVFCQTHRDLISYIQNSGSTIGLPCLIRTGSLGRAKIRIDNMQMLRNFATIIATNEQSCTIEQQLEVKCDLVVQRLGTSLKLFKRNLTRKSSTCALGEGATPTGGGSDSTGEFYGSVPVAPQKQPASRQTSLGAGVLSSFMSTGSGGGGGGVGGQQMSLQQSQSPGSRRSSNPSQQQQQQQQQCANSSAGFEKLADVNARYRQWVEAIASEFDNKLEAFCIKLVVASNDREYIVGLRNCSLDFLGSQDNQDEDRRSFVELVISKMNTILPKHQPVSREVSGRSDSFGPLAAPGGPNLSDLAHHVRRTSSEDETRGQPHSNNNRSRSVSSNQTGEQVASACGAGSMSYKPTQLSSSTLPASIGRRSSERSVETTHNNSLFSTGDDDPRDRSQPSGQYSRQFSLGQSFFDQTSTALSSFQRQSMSFLKRLDTRTGSETGAGSPGLISAKSDLGFDRNLSDSTSRGTGSPPTTTYNRANNINSTFMEANQQAEPGPRLTGPPPKPPPPPPPPPSALSNRQSSLASYSSSSLGSGQTRAGQRRADSTAAAPGGSSSLIKSRGPMTPQNSLSQAGPSRRDSGGELRADGAPESRSTQALPTSQRQNQQVMRQNSALSAFEPFDPSLRSETSQTALVGADSQPMAATAATGASPAPARKVSAGGNYDTVSMKSGNSNTSDETTTTEDTMNNLKKTFASIFGDKCE